MSILSIYYMEFMKTKFYQSEELDTNNTYFLAEKISSIHLLSTTSYHLLPVISDGREGF